MAARMRAEQIAQALVIDISGEIDHWALEELRPDIEQVLTSERMVVLGFAGVPHAGSSFLRLLIRASRAAAQVGTVLRIAGMPDVLIRCVTYSGLSDVIRAWGDVIEAATSPR